MKPFFEFKNERGGFGVVSQFDESFGGSQLCELWDFVFPVTKEKSFELGAIVVVERALSSVPDESLDFLEGGGRWGGRGCGSGFLFSDKENGEQSENPEYAKNNEQGLVATQF